MFSDSIPNASIPIASANPKDFSKKKRGNRLAKLKQCKQDARREQWLSQVKSKAPKEELNGGGETHSSRVEVVNERGRPIGKLEVKSIVEEYNDGLVHNCNNLDSPANSPTSYTSSIMGGTDSGTNFTGSSSRSSSSGGCCSGSVSEDEEEDDGCLDDWEAVADALAATEEKQEHKSSLGTQEKENCNVVQSISQTEVSNIVSDVVDKSGGLAPRSHVSYRAWRADDALRPQNLPNLSKQYSFPMNSGRHICGGSAWGHKNLSVPTSCPICYEDLDLTDTSFIPCSCGFKLCLFCHKRILEEDGRCPGCRKQYDCNPLKGESMVDGGRMEFPLARSCSMISRS